MCRIKVPHSHGKRGGISKIALLASGVLLGGMLCQGTAAEPSRSQPAPGRGPAAHPSRSLLSGVVVERGKLSVSLRGARFQDVMEAIGEQSGIEISLLGEVGQTTLTESFTGLPLEEGLVNLLRDKNFAFVYSNVEGARRVTRVVVTPRRSGASVEAPPTATIPPPESMRSTLDTLGAMPVEPPIPASPGVITPSSAPPNMQDPTLPMGTTGSPQTPPGAQHSGPEAVR